tara:strand:- start:761 stop:1966 length:1206 start_codon:yes stop_codon:yes gene_type:complete
MTATFSQFKSKCILEVRGGSKKNVGQEGTRNIDKKFNILDKNKIRNIDKRIVSDARASLGDGGKKAMEKFGKEFNLNGDETNTKGRNIKKRQVQLNKTSNQNIPTNSVDDSVKSVKVNRTTVDKTINTNVVKGSGDGITASKGGDTTVKPNTNTVKNPKKTLDSEISNRKLQQLKNQELIKKQMGTLDDLSDGGNTSNTNVKKNVVKTNTRGSSFKRPKLKYDLIGNKLDGKIGSQVFNQNKISNTTSGKTKVELPKFSQQSIDTAKGSSKTFVKPKNFTQFRKGTATLNKVKPLTKVVRGLGVAGAIADAGVSGYQSYSDSQKKGDSKLKSLGRSAATVAGGVLGGVTGAAIASPIPIPGARVAGGYLGYQKGKEYATKAFDTLTSRKGRMKFKDFVANR